MSSFYQGHAAYTTAVLLLRGTAETSGVEAWPGLKP